MGRKEEADGKEYRVYRERETYSAHSPSLYSSCVQSLRRVCPYYEQPGACARALPVVPIAHARSRPVSLRTTSHSVPRPSVASLFGVGVEIHDSVVRWAKMRARPNTSAVAWRPSASASEAVSDAQRSTFSLAARRIRRAMCASANREREDGSEGQGKAGRRWWRPSAKVYRSVSQRTPRRMQNLAYILFRRARARIPKKKYRLTSSLPRIQRVLPIFQGVPFSSSNTPIQSSNVSIDHDIHTPSRLKWAMGGRVVLVVRRCV
jgi:hypothetical protein